MIRAWFPVTFKKHSCWKLRKEYVFSYFSLFTSAVFLCCAGKMCCSQISSANNILFWTSSKQEQKVETTNLFSVILLFDVDNSVAGNLIDRATEIIISQLCPPSEQPNTQISKHLQPNDSCDIWPKVNRFKKSLRPSAAVVWEFKSVPWMQIPQLSSGTLSPCLLSCTPIHLLLYSGVQHQLYSYRPHWEFSVVVVFLFLFCFFDRLL